LPEHKGIYDKDEDDRVCGRMGRYKDILKVTPGLKLTYQVVIEPIKPWRGYIDFRCDIPEGMRVAHHPCTIRANKTIEKFNIVLKQDGQDE
jgi:hypothetical protein